MYSIPLHKDTEVWAYEKAIFFELVYSSSLLGLFCEVGLPLVLDQVGEVTKSNNMITDSSRDKLTGVSFSPLYKGTEDWVYEKAKFFNWLLAYINMIIAYLRHLKLNHI